jgi:membrane-bound lytic murein transglycosylase D
MKALLGVLSIVLASFLPSAANHAIPIGEVEDTLGRSDSQEHSMVLMSEEIKEFPNGFPVDSALFMQHSSTLEFEIPLDYNSEVKRFVEYFGTSWQVKLKEMISLSEFYFPVYESILDKYNLPLELKYVSIIESALNPHATSVSGAVGLWQFMPYTGKSYDLSIDRYVDERKHIEKSTEAAAQYFKDMSNVFDDWLVVIASYNCGPGNIRKAMRASGGKTTFWEIYPYLPAQTRHYIPSFIAVAYLMNFYQEYGIVPSKSKEPGHDFSFVNCSNNCSLDAVAEILGTSKEELLRWNPALKNGSIPVNKDDFPLYMPADRCYTFLECEGDIVDMSKEIVAIPTKSVYVVRRGDSLQAISNKMGCSVGELKSWNNLRSSMIHPGQRLVLYL